VVLRLHLAGRKTCLGDTEEPLELATLLHESRRYLLPHLRNEKLCYGSWNVLPHTGSLAISLMTMSRHVRVVEWHVAN